MLYGVVGEDGEDSCHADAVVGPEGGAVGSEPFAVEDRLDSVVHKVELLVAVLLADHVHVSLQANALRLLIAFRGGLADKDVAEVIVEGLEAMITTKLLQIGRDAFLVFRRARYLHYLAKIAPYGGGFQI